MVNKRWKMWVFTVAVLGAAVLMSWAWELYASRVASPPVMGPVKEVNGIKTQHSIPAFRLIAQDGGAYTSKEVEGKIQVANFFFTACPVICPRMMANMQVVYDAYRKDTDVVFLSITVDPKRDDANRLNTYAQNLGAETGRWNFLTGDKQEIYKLARNGYLVAASEVTGEVPDFIHSENIVLVDGQGRIRGYYNGMERKQMDVLRRDIAKLKKKISS